MQQANYFFSQKNRTSPGLYKHIKLAGMPAGKLTACSRPTRLAAFDACWESLDRWRRGEVKEEVKGNREGLELRERGDKGGKEDGTEKKQKMFTETVELGVLVP